VIGLPVSGQPLMAAAGQIRGSGTKIVTWWLTATIRGGPRWSRLR